MRKNRRYQKNWPENPHGEGLAEFYDGEGDDLPPELPSSPPPSLPSHADWDGGSLYSNEAGSYLGNTPSESVSLNSESVSSLDHLGYHSNYNTNRPDSRYVRQCDKFDWSTTNYIRFTYQQNLLGLYFVCLFLAKQNSLRG